MFAVSVCSGIRSQEAGPAWCLRSGRESGTAGCDRHDASQAALDWKSGTAGILDGNHERRTRTPTIDGSFYFLRERSTDASECHSSPGAQRTGEYATTA